MHAGQCKKANSLMTVPFPLTSMSRYAPRAPSSLNLELQDTAVQEQKAITRPHGRTLSVVISNSDFGMDNHYRV